MEDNDFLMVTPILMKQHVFIGTIKTPNLQLAYAETSKGQLRPRKRLCTCICTCSRAGVAGNWQRIFRFAGTYAWSIRRWLPGSPSFAPAGRPRLPGLFLPTPRLRHGSWKIPSKRDPAPPSGSPPKKFAAQNES